MRGAHPRRGRSGRAFGVAIACLVGVGVSTGALPARAEAEPPDDAAAAKISSAPPLPPLETSFLQYGVALASEFVLSSGAMCERDKPCVLGSGGGVLLHAGVRSAGAWYLGGAYEVTKQDAANLYRLATLQQLRVEARYYLTTGRITQPFAAAGAGLAVYGNELSIETKGPLLFVAIGAETQLSLTNVIAVAITYRTAYFTPFDVPNLPPREGSLAHFFALDIALDLLDPR